MTGSLNRRIMRLAVPAFAALVAQPLFLMTDTAIVGRLGIEPLAGLGIGAAVLGTMTGLFIFLAYASTSTVARLAGAGRAKEAAEAGIQALWLALLISAAVGVLSWVLAPWFAAWLGAEGAVHAQAVTYLRWALVGTPGIMVMLAATGTLRGLADGRTPMLLSLAAAALNLVGDLVLVFGLGMGIAGSGAATAIAELALGGVAAWLVLRGGARLGARRRPERAGITRSLRTGLPLLVRTCALRLALLLTTWAAARQGAVPLAAHQVCFTIWGFLQNALDALAIAGQTLIGQALGGNRADRARAITRRMIAWSFGIGALLGLAVVVARHPFATLFTPEVEVRHTVAVVLVVVGAALVISSWVTLFDGVLIGAGDGPYLARAMTLALVAYAPLVLVVDRLAPTGVPSLAWLWASFTVGFMGVRALTLWWRERSDAWLRTG